MPVAGIGCRRICPASDIVAAVQAAELAAGCRVGALAAPAFKRDQPGLHEAAAVLGLPLRFIDDAELARVQPDCVTHSPTALRATGTASVAEGAALAAAGPPLRLARITHGAATCAIAGPDGWYR